MNLGDMAEDANDGNPLPPTDEIIHDISDEEEEEDDDLDDDDDEDDDEEDVEEED